MGVLSRALGRRPILAYRLVSLAAALRAGRRDPPLARRGRVPRTHALPALLLVVPGRRRRGRLLRRRTAAPIVPRPGRRPLPVLEVMANPHFVVGTALLLWALRAFARAAEGGLREVAAAAALGSLLALTRPYDLVLLAAIRAIVVVATEPPRRWLRPRRGDGDAAPGHRVPRLGLLRRPRVRGPGPDRYVFPSPAAFAWALGPAAVVGLAAGSSVDRHGASAATPGRARGAPPPLRRGSASPPR